MAVYITKAPPTKGLRGRAKEVAMNPQRLAQMNRLASRMGA